MNAATSVSRCAEACEMGRQGGSGEVNGRLSALVGADFVGCEMLYGKVGASRTLHTDVPARWPLPGTAEIRHALQTRCSCTRGKTPPLCRIASCEGPNLPPLGQIARICPPIPSSAPLMPAIMRVA